MDKRLRTRITAFAWLLALTVSASALVTPPTAHAQAPSQPITINLNMIMGGWHTCAMMAPGATNWTKATYTINGLTGGLPYFISFYIYQESELKADGNAPIYGEYAEGNFKNDGDYNYFEEERKESILSVKGEGDKLTISYEEDDYNIGEETVVEKVWTVTLQTPEFFECTLEDGTKVRFARGMIFTT